MVRASTFNNARRQRVYSRREIEGMIADGRTILIINNKVLKADAWLQYHPGGDKAIRHMVGRDGTDEIQACVHYACLCLSYQNHLD